MISEWQPVEMSSPVEQQTLAAARGLLCDAAPSPNNTITVYLLPPPPSISMFEWMSELLFYQIN